MDVDSNNVVVDDPSLQGFPVELKIEILARRAFLHLDDMFMADLSEDRLMLESLYDEIRDNGMVLVGPLLHNAWHGGLYDCEGWAQSQANSSDFAILCVRNEKEDQRPLALREKHFRRTCSIKGYTFYDSFMSSRDVKIEVRHCKHPTRRGSCQFMCIDLEHLKTICGSRFDKVECQKTRRAQQLLYYFKVACPIYPIALLSYSCLNARDSILFDSTLIAPTRDAAFSTLSNKRFRRRFRRLPALDAPCPFDSTCSGCCQCGIALKNMLGGFLASILVKHGYTFIPSSNDDLFDFELKRCVSKSLTSRAYIWNRQRLPFLLEYLPKACVASLLDAIDPRALYRNMTQQEVADLIWTAICKLERRRTYDMRLNCLEGSVFENVQTFADENLIALVLPSPWNHVLLDRSEGCNFSVLLPETPTERKVLQEFYDSNIASLNRVKPCRLEELMYGDLLTRPGHSPIHRILAFIQKDSHWAPAGVAFECHCNSEKSDIVIKRDYPSLDE